MGQSNVLASSLTSAVGAQHKTVLTSRNPWLSLRLPGSFLLRFAPAEVRRVVVPPAPPRFTRFEPRLRRPKFFACSRPRITPVDMDGSAKAEESARAVHRTHACLSLHLGNLAHRALPLAVPQQPAAPPQPPCPHTQNPRIHPPSQERHPFRAGPTTVPLRFNSTASLALKRSSRSPANSHRNSFESAQTAKSSM